MKKSGSKYSKPQQMNFSGNKMFVTNLLFETFALTKKTEFPASSDKKSFIHNL